MSTEQKPTVPFILSLISGIFTLIGGLTVAYAGRWHFEFMQRMMSGYGYAFGQGPGYALPFVWFMGIPGVIFGVVLIVGSVMLIQRPRQHETWGILILVFSILSIFGGVAGCLLGLVLGIVGGALAIAWKPATTS